MHRPLRPFFLLGLLLAMLVGAAAGAQSPDAAKETGRRVAQLIRAAEVDLASGALQEGLVKANQAATIALEADDDFGLAAARVVRANLLLASGSPARAGRDFESVLASPPEDGGDAIVMAAKTGLANVRVAEGRGLDAIALYDEVALSAERRGAIESALRARVNGLRAWVDAGRTPGVEERSALRARIAALPGKAMRARFEIHVATTVLHVLEAGRSEGDARRVLFAEANADLRSALLQADELDTPVESARIRAQALGALGRLYALEDRDDEALVLTRRAMVQASRAEADASVFPWHLQSGRLLARLERRDESIAAYASALQLLEAHRGAIERTQRLAPPRAGAPESVALHREYVDQLLRRARTTTDEAARRDDLLTAQAVLEGLKSDELRNYFEDDCVIRYRERLESVTDASSEAAIVYPVLLDDRLEMLVSAGGELHQVVVPVDRQRLREEVVRFRRLLEKRTTREYLRPARQLDAWLIRPIRPLLEAARPRTLVFVPDGILRTVPMAALHDGDRFLIERYALGLTPGLELTDPRPFQGHERTALVAGVSEGVQGFAPLPHVEQEFSAIRSLTEGTGLLNEEFEGDRLTSRIREGDYGLIHIASHAQFDASASGGFMLAHDGRVSFDDLADAVSSSMFRDEPLDLVVLSACETAQGDERAALGLSGIAVKAGARSALGTLWSVSDAATTVFMTRFYSSLGEPGTSRAEAVRAAQLRLLEERTYRHPFYWSPFLLINSWL